MSSSASPRRETTADRIARVAGRQWGVIARWQLIACGLSATGIRRWLARGHLYELYPGVYAVGHPALTTEGQLTAALFHAGAGAALSHGTAAWWWELTPIRETRIHVSVPRRRRVDERLIVHHPRELTTMRHRRLVVTPLCRTLLDFAATASARRVRKALAEADFRHGLNPASLLPWLGRGLPGSAALRRAIDAHLPELARTASPMEDDFLFFCEEHGLPTPSANRRIAGKKVDACWPEHRLIVELDSVGAHASAPRRLVDRERDLHLRRLNYTVLRYTWHQLHETPEAVAADLRQMLALSATDVTATRQSGVR